MEKSQIRPAAAAFLLMLTMSLLSTALSFFVSPVCEELVTMPVLIALGILALIGALRKK